MYQRRGASRGWRKQGSLTLGRRVLGLVRKRQTLALGEWKGVRKTQDSEKASEVGGVFLEEAGVRS